MADWAIADSNGAANILIVSIPDFPVLKVETDAFIAQLGTNCAACTYDELNVTLDDLGRVYDLDYDENGRLTTATDFSGRQVTYAYDEHGRLASVTSPARAPRNCSMAAQSEMTTASGRPHAPRMRSNTPMPTASSRQ